MIAPYTGGIRKLLDGFEGPCAALNTPFQVVLRLPVLLDLFQCLPIELEAVTYRNHARNSTGRGGKVRRQWPIETSNAVVAGWGFLLFEEQTDLHISREHVEALDKTVTENSWQITAKRLKSLFTEKRFTRCFSRNFPVFPFIICPLSKHADSAFRIFTKQPVYNRWPQQMSLMFK